MKKRVSKLLVAGAVLASAGLSAGQAVPSLINYQGFVTDASGTPLGTPATNYEIAFALYDSATGGNLLWAEKQVITVVDGQFSTLLGQGAQVDIIGDANVEPKPALENVFDDTLRFLSLRVLVPPATDLKNAPEIAPRQQIVSSPFAVRAQIANTVEVNAIGPAQLADGAVEGTDIAGNAINASKIADGSLLPADLLPNSLTAGQIATGAVGSDEIADGAIATGDIAGSAITGSLIANRTITGADISNSANITGTQILNETITTSDIDDGTITSADISSNANITGTQILNESITTSDIDNGTITSSDISSSANINGGQILNGTLTAIDLHSSVGVFSKASNGVLTYVDGTDPTLKLKSTGTSVESGRVALRQSNESGVDVYYDGSSAVEGLLIRAVSSGTEFTGNGIYVSNRNDGTRGRVGINKTDPFYTLDVGGSIRMSQRLFVKNPGTGNDVDVEWNATSGEIKVNSSSKRFKDQISAYEFDADQILKIVPKKYVRKEAPDDWETGYIAEEIADLGLTDLVCFDGDNKPFAIHYDKVPLYLTEVVKGHRETIETLEEENETLKERLERLEKLVGKLAGETVE